MGPFLMFVSAAAMGAVLALAGADTYWQGQTVAHNCAAYDSKTRAWGWTQ